MIFLIQTVNKEIVHDYSFELISAIRFQKEFNNRSDIDYRKVSLTLLDKYYTRYDKQYVPIGTVEFVQLYFKRFFNYELKPINIPDCLMERGYTKRHVFFADQSDINNNDNKKYFIKDHDIIKRGGYPKIDTLKNGITDDHVYQVSEVVDIDTEYRCFVHNNQLIDIRRYLGSFESYPDIDYIQMLIGEYSYHNPPKAYTLDVGINKDLGTFIIEVHDFYSCGFYGFSNYNKIPFMFSQWYYNKSIQINK